MCICLDSLVAIWFEVARRPLLLFSTPFVISSLFRYCFAMGEATVEVESETSGTDSAVGGSVIPGVKVWAALSYDPFWFSFS